MSTLTNPSSEDAEVIEICIDCDLSDAEEEKAQELAEAANPLNLIERTRLDPATGASISIGFEYRKCWPPGTELHIRFLDGLPAVQEKVKQVALEWTKVANIKFNFDDSPEAQIRISFAPGGSSSYIGLDALRVPKDRPTMKLGWLKPETPDEEYDRVVLHEFGHALGAIHEHQSPRGGIPWDRAKVIAYYSGDPNYWDEQKIQFNVLDRYSEDRVNASEFDPYSIMLYPVPRSLTRDGFEIPWHNSKLSDMDKKWVKMMYPLGA